MAVGPNPPVPVAIAHSGFHLAKITSAMAMKPRPAVIPSAQVSVSATDTCAPAVPPSMPARVRA